MHFFTVPKGTARPLRTT